MRADGLWHPRLAAVLAGMGHTEQVVLADPGLPVPPDVERIDLVWARDQPPLLPVLDLVLSELVVESAVWATQAKDPALVSGLSRALSGIATTRVDHEQLKARTRQARAVVRTGEATPYANVILTAGVPF